jgi:hypothetical protein
MPTIGELFLLGEIVKCMDSFHFKKTVEDIYQILVNKAYRDVQEMMTYMNDDDKDIINAMIDKDPLIELKKITSMLNFLVNENIVNKYREDNETYYFKSCMIQDITAFKVMNNIESSFKSHWNN